MHAIAAIASIAADVRGARDGCIQFTPAGELSDGGLIPTATALTLVSAGPGTGTAPPRAPGPPPGLRVQSAGPMVAQPDASPPAPALLARVAAGDRAAINDVIATYGSLVWSLARRFDPANADDAVQEIFLDLWKSAARFDPAVASEVTFVAMIARRRLIDRRRSLSRRPVAESVDQWPAVADGASSPDVRAEAAEAARALDQLRPEQRQVLVLSTCHGLSHGEIASQTGMPLGTVKAHVRRGLLAIRAALLGGHGEVR